MSNSYYAPSYASSTSANSGWNTNNVRYTSSTIATSSTSTVTTQLLINGNPESYRMQFPPRDTDLDCDLCGADIYNQIYWEIDVNGNHGRPFCSNNCRTLTFQADARLEREALESLGVISPDKRDG